MPRRIRNAFMTAFTVLFIVLCSLPAGAMAGEESVSVLVFEMPPWSFHDKNKEWTGLGVDLTRTLANEAGYRLAFQTLPWNRALEYLRSGRLDIIFFLSKTPEREQYVHFLGPSAYEQVCLVVRKENTGLKLQTFDDMAQPDFLWGIRDNTFYSKEFNHRLETDPDFSEHFERIAKFAINLQRVKAGRIIGLLGDYFAASHILKTTADWSDLRVVRTPFFKPTPVYFGASAKLPPQKLGKLQAAYDALQARGAFEKIVQKWIEPGP